jgi:hypothetical protein
LDYVLNDARICSCNCNNCKIKMYHPVSNCELECKNRENFVNFYFFNLNILKKKNLLGYEWYWQWIIKWNLWL